MLWTEKQALEHYEEKGQTKRVLGLDDLVSRDRSTCLNVARALSRVNRIKSIL